MIFLLPVVFCGKKNRPDNQRELAIEANHNRKITTIMTEESIASSSDKRKRAPHNFRDLAGETFGRLTIIRRSENNGLPVRWECQCSCGETANVSSHSLLSGSTRSCGCLRIDVLRSRRTHGMSNVTPEYRAWRHMQSRCENPKVWNYKKYGGRGISVCERWTCEHGFENFFLDMGLRPSSEHSLDRINLNGDYLPENCRWATKVEQARNKSNTAWFTLRGETKCLKEWCLILGKNYKLAHKRIRYKGWSIERAMGCT